MSIVEFFKENWGILIPSCIAIFGIILMYWIHCKGKTEKEREFKENIQLRLGTLEKSMELLTTLYPQLKSLEKLDSFKKLNLTQDDIRKIVSEVLQTTNIIPEAIELTVEEKIEKKLSSFDNGIATIIAQKLNLIDKQFGKPTGNTSDYLTLASVEYSKGNYLKTTQYLDKAIEINPNYAIAWYNKGTALGKLALHDEALKAYDKAIEINPNYAKAWYGKACMYYLKKDKKNALKYLSQAIELDPKYKKDAKKFENI